MRSYRHETRSEHRMFISELSALLSHASSGWRLFPGLGFLACAEISFQSGRECFSSPCLLPALATMTWNQPVFTETRAVALSSQRTVLPMPSLLRLRGDVLVLICPCGIIRRSLLTEAALDINCGWREGIRSRCLRNLLEQRWRLCYMNGFNSVCGSATGPS